jgi:integrase
MPAKRPTSPIERGIRQDGDRLQAYVYVGGRTRSKYFPIGTSITTLRQWRENTRVRHRLGLQAEAGATTFREDAETYLKLVRSMPTFKDREYRILQWAEEFGDRSRASIKAHEIRGVLERWRLRGSFEGGPLSPGSINVRRTALMHLYTVLDGKWAANPVKDVPPHHEDTRDQIRAQSISIWYRLLARIRKGSKTRARLRLMLWTGWPHAQIMLLKPEDIDWPRSRVRLQRRKKGRGHPAKWLPVLPQAVTALREFDRVGAWGKFSQSAMHSSLAVALKQENEWRESHGKKPLPKIRPYDARHQFATTIASMMTDERALQGLMLHSTAAMTRRYSVGADDARMEQAISAVAGKLLKFG